jgi:hypothetical protein
MKPKERKAFLLLQRNLKNQSFAVYLRILDSLLRSHRDKEWLKPLADALRRRDFVALFHAADSLSSQKYDDATQHFVANQFALLVKKYPFPSDKLDLGARATAVKTFMASEKRTKLVNRKFKFLGTHHSRDRFLEQSRSARHWIHALLGTRPNYKQIFSKCDFGAGASVGVHGNATHILAKLHSEKWSVTPGAIHHAFGGLMRNHHYMEQLLPHGPDGRFVCFDYVHSFTEYTRRMRVVQHNKISFVPKTVKTERTIAVEPLLNGYVQKGTDLVLREKLRKVGIDLTSQELNQRMALKGSQSDDDDSLVTIDLKSASDSISIELVRYLLPSDWFSLLDRTRSKAYELDKVVTTYEKFCSMGNGFCFPLETILFAAACHASGAGRPGVDFMVYGDDIIVTKRVANQVLSLLRYWGFKHNPDKTFLEGPFRESCGADWFGGEDVRPYTLDHALDSVENVFKFLNLTRRGARTEKFFAPVRDTVVKLLPLQFQFFRPLPGQADTGIDSSGDEHLTCSNASLSRDGRWKWKELMHTAVNDDSRLADARDKPWLIGVALRGASSLPHGELVGLPGVSFRNKTRTKVVRKGYSSTSNWLPTPQEC